MIMFREYYTGEVNIMNFLEIPVSVGELVDKITILRLKVDNGIDAAQNELDDLEKIYSSLEISSLVWRLEEVLYRINQQCWVVEEEKRAAEKEKNFDKEFIEVARAVYYLNDLRAEVKRKINAVSDSKIKEYKSHGDY